MKIKRSFPARLSLYIILASTTLVLLAIFGIQFYSYKTISEEAQKNAKANLNTIISDIETIISSVEAVTNNNAKSVGYYLDDLPSLRRVTSAPISKNSYVTGSFIAFEPYYTSSEDEYYGIYSADNGKGQIVTIKEGDNEYDYFTLDWYQIPMLINKPYWSEPYFDELAVKQMFTTYSVPVRDRSGHPYAILTADLSLDRVTEKLSQHLPYESAYPVLLSKNGSFISFPDKTITETSTVFSVALTLGSDQLLELGKKMLAHETGVEKIGIQGEKNYIVYGPVSNGWTAAIVCPFDEIFAGVRKMSIWLLITSILDLFLMFFFIRRIINRQTQSITEFTYAALNVSKGNFKARIPQVNTEDELKRLHDSMEYLLDSVNQYITQLKTTTASKERFESELNVASTIQDSMLSKNFPKHDLVDVYATIHPAKEVGGDLYDFRREGDRLYVAVGDVSGKGVPAALLMAITKSAFRFVSGLSLGTNGAISRINDALSDGNDMGMFVTLVTIKITLDDMMMDFTNAGHNPMLIVYPDGHAEYLKCLPNIACGLFPGFEYKKEFFQLQRGMRIVMYTDGVTEAENASKDQYGEQRLLEFAQSRPQDEDSESFVNALLDSVKEFANGNDQNDDITALSILIK